MQQKNITIILYETESMIKIIQLRREKHMFLQIENALKTFT